MLQPIRFFPTATYLLSILPSTTQPLNNLLIIPALLLQNQILNGLEHGMHRLRSLKLDGHQLNALITQVKRPLTTVIQYHINILEPVPAGLI